MRPNKQLGFAANFFFNLQHAVFYDKRWWSHLKLTVTSIVCCFFWLVEANVSFVYRFVCLFVVLDPFFNVKSTLKLQSAFSAPWILTAFNTHLQPISFRILVYNRNKHSTDRIVNFLLQLEDAKEWKTRCSWFYHVVLHIHLINELIYFVTVKAKKKI